MSPWALLAYTARRVTARTRPRGHRPHLWMRVQQALRAGRTHQGRSLPSPKASHGPPMAGDSGQGQVPRARSACLRKTRSLPCRSSPRERSEAVDLTGLWLTSGSLKGLRSWLTACALRGPRLSQPPLPPRAVGNVFILNSRALILVPTDTCGGWRGDVCWTLRAFSN